MARGVGGHGPANIMKHLKGIHFPVGKSQILELAKMGEGLDTEEVLEVLDQIPDKEYNNITEITKAVGEI